MKRSHQSLLECRNCYRKTPLISTYVFSGLATEQVLIFGAVLTFGGYDKTDLSGGMIRRSEKSCKEGVCSIQCFPHTTRCCACFSDYAHTSRIQGYLYSGGGGGCTFGALQPTVNFSKNWRVLIFGGVLIYGVLRYLAWAAPKNVLFLVAKVEEDRVGRSVQNFFLDFKIVAMARNSLATHQPVNNSVHISG